MDECMHDWHIHDEYRLGSVSRYPEGKVTEWYCSKCRRKETWVKPRFGGEEIKL